MKKLARIAMLVAVALCAAAGATDADARNVSLNPSFDPDTMSYRAAVPHDVTEVVFNVAAQHPKAAVTVNGGDPAAPVQLAVGRNTIEIVVTTEDARHTRTYTVVVTREAASSSADLAGLTAEAGADGSWSALDIGAFDADAASYSASVPYAKTHARLIPTAADAAATVTGGAEVALEEGENVLSVEVTAEDGTTKTYTVTVTREAEGPRLTASFGGRPYEHDGATAFRFVVLLNEPLGAGAGKVSAASFEVTNGRVASVREIKSDYYFVHVRPDGWKDVTVTLRGGRDCAEAGAVCAGDGRRLWNSPSMTLGGPPAPALTAALENVPSEHDGGAAFAFDLRFSEALGEGGVAPSAASFAVQAGSVAGVERVSAGLWRVRVQPKNWKDVTVTLSTPPDCAAAGAVCTADGRALSNAPAATVGGPVRIRVEGARAKEEQDASLEFAVTLNRAAAHEVSVDYATGDDTAVAGSDYTATSGTLVFAAGETAKTVSVPLLDDAVDEGKEVMHLHLSNPQGAFLRSIHRQARGIIVNDDPLQKKWLSRFGRTVAVQTVEALEGRFAIGAEGSPRMTMTVAGQSMDLSRLGDGAAQAETMTGLARAFGAPGVPAANPGSGSPGSSPGQAGAGYDPFARLSDVRNDPGASAPARSMTGRELLSGTSFHFTTGDASGLGGAMTGWGKVLSGGSSGSFGGGLSLASETSTGVLGMDWERDRLLFGVALSRSVETGSASFAPTGSEYGIEGSLSMVTPYLQVRTGERLSFWSAVGSGSGSMSLSWDGTSQSADISMQLAAAGGRAELLRPGAGGGFALALKTDAFFVRTESARVSTPGVGNLASARGDASRVRALLEGSRSFALAGGGALEPSLSVGLRHDGGDAQTGSGVEAGAGLVWSDPSAGLTSDLRVYALAAHESGGYEEWGASGSLRVAPDPSGRGLSLSLTPSWGAQGQSGRLWGSAPGSLAGTGAAGDGGQPGMRLDTELGYGLPLSEGLTGTPYAGLGLGEADARDWRLGLRFSSARLRSFTLGVEATRREAANDNGAGKAEHGVMVSGALRW